MFEEEDDATRYSLLLEAQDFMTPSVESIDREEVEEFCSSANYESRLVPKGFVPEDEFDRLLIAPPQRNLEQSNWEEGEEPKDPSSRQVPPQNEPSEAADSEPSSTGSDLDDIRRRLEGLL